MKNPLYEPILATMDRIVKLVGDESGKELVVMLFYDDSNVYFLDVLKNTSDDRSVRRIKSKQSQKLEILYSALRLLEEVIKSNNVDIFHLKTTVSAEMISYGKWVNAGIINNSMKEVVAKYPMIMATKRYLYDRVVLNTDVSQIGASKAYFKRK